MTERSTKKWAFRWLLLAPVLFAVLGVAEWAAIGKVRRARDELAKTCDRSRSDVEASPQCRSAFERAEKYVEQRRQRMWTHWGMSCACLALLSLVHRRRRQTNGPKSVKPGDQEGAGGV